MSKRLFGAVLLGLCLMAFGFVCSSALAAQGINRQVSYQGKLLDSTGVAVTDGTYQMKFNLYSAASGGVTLWAASGTTILPTAIPVTVQNGLFSIMLGDSSASGGWQNTLDGVDWNSNGIYLGITIGSDSEMSPRKRLGAVPQAFNAEQLQGMYASSSASGGQSLFAIHQTENNAATGTRSALEIRTDGTSVSNDLLIRGVDGGPNITTFTVNRLGSVTSTGQLAFSGSGTSTLSGSLSVGGTVSSTNAFTGNLVVVGRATLGTTSNDLITVNGAINSSLIPSNDYIASLGQIDRNWLNGYIANVSSTNATSTYLFAQNATLRAITATTLNALGLVWTNATGTNTTSTNLYANFLQFTDALGTNVTSTSLAVIGSATTTFGGDINVAGTVSSTDAMVSRNALIDGNLVVNGNATLGNIGSDYVTVNGSINSSLLPALDGAVSLGTTGLRWLNGSFVNVSSTNATSTYLYATSLQFGNASGTNVTAESYGTSFTTSSVSLLGSVSAVGAGDLRMDVEWPYAYVLDATNNVLRSFDVSRETGPVALSTVDISSGATAIRVSGGYAYVLFGGALTASLQTFAVSNPGSMSSVGSVDLSGLGSSFAALEVDGSTAYFSVDAMLYAVNVSDPSTPRILSSLLMSGGGNVVLDLHARTDGYLYVSVPEDNAIYIVRKTDPSHLSTVSSVSVAYPGYLASRGSYLFTTHRAAGYVEKMDISNPLSPGASSAMFAMSGQPAELFSSGRYLYASLTAGSGGFAVIDTMDPTVGRLVATIDGAYFGGAIRVYGSHLVIASSSGNALLTTYRLPGADLASVEAGSLLGGGLVVQQDGKIGRNLTVGNSFVVGSGGLHSSGALAVGATSTSSTIMGNLFVGTSTADVATHPSFVMNGDDLFVAGNIGSATSVYTNGSFIAGTGSTYYNASSLINTTGSFTASSTQGFTVVANNNVSLRAGIGINIVAGSGDISLEAGSGFVLGPSDGAISLGSSTKRFNGEFLNTTTTNVTSTSLAVTGTATTTFAGDVSAAGGVSTTRAYATSLIVDGTTRLGSQPSDYVTVNGQINSSLYPSTDGTLSFGADTLRWGQGSFVNVSSTNATSTYFYTEHATIANVTSSRLFVFDEGSFSVADQSTIPQVAAVSAGTSPAKIIVDDRFAYVANTSTNSLRYFDVASSTSPMIYPSVPLAGTGLTDIALRGHYIFSVQSDGSFRVRDIYGDETGSLSGLGSLEAVAVQGSYAYVLAPTTLYVIDVSVVTQPKVIASFVDATYLPSGAKYLAVQGRYVYVASTGSTRFSTIDVSNPSQPQGMGFVSILTPLRIAVQGGYAYTASATGMNIVSVVVASTPAVVGTYSTTDVRDVFVSGDYAFLTTANGLEIVDVTDRSAPVLRKTVSIANAVGVFVRGRDVFVTDSDGQDALRVFRIPGINAMSINAHSAQAGTLLVLGDGRIGNQLDVEGGLSVGEQGIVTTGALTVHSANATSIFAGNLMVGTSSIEVAVHPSFQLNGDDLFVGGNIGSASSVYTNGAFIAGSGSTYYGNNYITNLSGDFSVTSSGALSLIANSAVTIAGQGISLDSGGVSLSLSTTKSIVFHSGQGEVRGDADGAVSLGTASTRFDGQFRNTTSSIAYITSGHIQDAVFDNATSANAFATSLRSTNATTTYGRVSGGLYADVASDSAITSLGTVAAGPSPGDVWADDRYVYVVNTSTNSFSYFHAASSTPPGLFTTVANSSEPTGISVRNDLFYSIHADGRLEVGGASVSVGGTPTDMAVSGRYVYVTTRSPNQLVTVDAGDPSKPRVVSIITDGTALSDPTAIAVQDSALFVINQANNSISAFTFFQDPSRPTNLSTLGLSLALSPPQDLAVQGNYAYVLGSVGLGTVLITNPAGLVESSATVAVSSPSSLMVSGREVFVTGAAGVSIFDASNPASLVETGSIAMASANPIAAAIRGRFLYVTDAEPNNLLHVFRLPGIEATGGYFSSLQAGGLHVLGSGRIGQDFDVGGSLQVGAGGIDTIGSLSVQAANTTSSILGSLTVGTSTLDIAMHPSFVMNGDDLFVQGNIGSATSVYTNGSFIAGTGSTYYNAASIVNTSGDYTVTSTGNLTLNANGQLSIAAPSGIIPTIDATAFGGSSNRFDAYLRYATTTGLDVKSGINQTISSATNWSTKSTFALLTGVTALQVVGDYVYSVTTTGLRITDVHNPSNPLSVGSITIGNNNQDIAVLGERAYITSNTGDAILVVNVADPSNPFLENTVTEVGGPTSIKIQGRYAYVGSSGTSGLSILDLGHATGPRLIARALSGNAVNDVALAGKYAYVTISTKVDVFDISDPYNPTLVGFYTAAGGFLPNTIVAQGGYLYVSDSAAASFQVLAASSTPYLVATKSTGGIVALPQGFSIQGNYLYAVGAAYGYLQAYDVSDPSNPLGVKTFSLGAAGADEGAVKVVGRYAYVGSENTDKYVSIVDLGGIEAANMRAESFQAGDLSVLGDGRIGGSLSLQGDAAVAGGIFAQGVSAFAASSTGPGMQIVNRASHATQKSSWGAYIDRLLVGETDGGAIGSTTGTDQYAMIIGYDSVSGGKHIGLCLKDIAHGGCPDASLLGNTSIIADDAITASAFDLAEMYLTVGDVTSTDVLVFGSASATAMRSSGVAYDPRIMGIASTRPGFVLGVLSGAPVALAGRVPTKVSTVNGAIVIGDPLTTSEYPGVAMKATKPGMIVGYALDAATATSTIEVFVKPGYSAGTILNTDGTVARLSDDLVVDARTTATEHAPTADSWGLTFRGSAWNDGVVTQPSFSLITNIVTPTSSAFVIRNASSTNVFAIDQTGTATIAGDLVVGGRLYPSGRGAAQNSKYIFLDDTSTSTQYMATNADGWQANDSYDFAERYYSPDALDTGDLVIASDRGQFHVQRSLNESGFLMGIVSTRPAFVAGKQGENTYPIALAGRVPTKVSNMNGAIKVGDALAPSTIPGTAVKATKAGPIVGLALEAYDAPTVGKIEVFVNPGWWGGPEAATSSVATTATMAPSGAAPAPTTVNADGSVSYRGFASIAMGSKRVHVAYDSVLSYPNIQVTPRGQVHGGWWTDNYTDIGFDIFMNDIQTRDITFAWSVEGTPTGARIYNSDGTYALVNPTTGEALVQTAATSTADVAPTPVVTTPAPTPAPAPAPAPVVTPPTSEVTTSTADATPTPVVTTPAPTPDAASSTTDTPAPAAPITIDASTGSVVTASTTDAPAPTADTASTTGL